MSSFTDPGDVLYRHVGVQPMLIEEIDGFDLEAPERCFRDTANVLGRLLSLPVSYFPSTMLCPNLVVTLRLVPVGIQPFTCEFLVDQRSVDLRGIEQPDAALAAWWSKVISALRSGWGPRL